MENEVTTVQQRQRSSVLENESIVIDHLEST